MGKTFPKGFWSGTSGVRALSERRTPEGVRYMYYYEYVTPPLASMVAVHFPPVHTVAVFVVPPVAPEPCRFMADNAALTAL